jgi:hypothetical protein
MKVVKSNIVEMSRNPVELLGSYLPLVVIRLVDRNYVPGVKAINWTSGKIPVALISSDNISTEG